jgi:uncharacterized protein (TIGR03000 family)
LTAWAATLAVAIPFFFASPAPAQTPGGYYYETFRYGYNPGYYARRLSAADVASPPRPTGKTITSGVTPGAYVYYFAPPAAGTVRTDRRTGAGRSWSSPATDTARIEVRVPEGAVVVFGGKASGQTGAVRRFESPPLKPGTDYSYAVTVTWSEGGKELTETRELVVRAGSLLTESFPAGGGD